MKSQAGPNLLLLLALGVLAHSMMQTPPGGASWEMFLTESSPLHRKVVYFFWAYMWPGVLSFCAIVAFQIQMRLGSGGAGRRVIFSLCLLASMVMLAGFRSLSLNPTAAPFYLLGMASAYTVTSHLYAVRMRIVMGRVRIPWPVWRGDHAGMAEVNRQMQEKMRAMAEARSASAAEARPS